MRERHTCRGPAQTSGVISRRSGLTPPPRPSVPSKGNVSNPNTSPASLGIRKVRLIVTVRLTVPGALQ